MRKLIFNLSAFAITALVSINSYSQKEPPPPKDVSIKPAGPAVTIDKFYKDNPSVASVYAVGDKKITIELKDGTKEKYNISDEKEKKFFLSKYGALPLLPPPPPKKIKQII